MNTVLPVWAKPKMNTNAYDHEIVIAERNTKRCMILQVAMCFQALNHGSDLCGGKN